MTIAISGSRRGRVLRAATAVGSVTLGLLALSACEKPTPLATVTVNGETVTAEAACYEDGKTIAEAEAKKCADKKAEKTISVGPGDKIRIGVEPDMAEEGWMLFVNDQSVLPKPTEKTYYSFPGDAFFQKQGATGQPEPTEDARISVIMTKGGDFKGAWHIKAEQEK
ncbi:DUF2771 domain-containing protein [Streptomyces sp. Z26]|uniref:DUF2771 domain-containing protein n=1 Tax=Streptomyces TaxID=1883 RepID=UPI000EF14164|nr:DUF2771 domain-containing protein [Streptomyces sp. Z26]RLL67432.1 DUF2771 domain-containing protein [Streptomyces sp. Z26]